MKKLKIALCVVLIIVILFGSLLLGTYFCLSCSAKDIRFPLAGIADDESEYILLKYSDGENYVIDDTSFLIKHKWDVFVICSTELENSTGDGYFRFYKNGECIFSCQFDDGEYFDKFINRKYSVYGSQELSKLIN